MATTLVRAARVLLCVLLCASLGAAQPALSAPPPLVRAPVPFGPERLAQTAAYSLRHYGEDTATLLPRALVLHYTCGPSYSSAWNTFASNHRHRREAPGVCAHYVVAQDGAVYELVPPTVRCRHAVGLNHVALGVELVQPCLRRGAGAEERALFARGAQLRATLSLVRYLRARYAIERGNVLGHGMANEHPLFRDLTGARNDHGDWGPRAMEEFLRRLDAFEAQP